LHDKDIINPTSSLLVQEESDYR